MSIKIITSPTLRLVGRQTIDEEALLGFLREEGAETWTSDTEIASQHLIECAGRLCYSSFSKPRPGGNAAYLNHILEVGHGSVIEHAIYNFIITGVSRSFTHELVRHRAGWAYSQRSQRFCDESELATVVPPALADEVESARKFIARFGEPAPSAVDAMNYVLRHKDVEGYAEIDLPAAIGLQWLAHMEQSRLAYSSLSDYLLKRDNPPSSSGKVVVMTESRKRAREAARSVLPNATETQIFVTANARALRHFIEARGDEHADAEIRRVAIAMLAILQVESPNLFGDYRVEERAGVQVIVTDYRKV